MNDRPGDREDVENDGFGMTDINSQYGSSQGMGLDSSPEVDESRSPDIVVMVHHPGGKHTPEFTNVLPYQSDDTKKDEDGTPVEHMAERFFDGDTSVEAALVLDGEMDYLLDGSDLEPVDDEGIVYAGEDPATDYRFAEAMKGLGLDPGEYGLAGDET